MDIYKKRMITGITIAVIAVILLGLLLFVLFRPKKSGDENSNRSQDLTTFYSPVAQTSDSLTVNYGSDVQPNTEAVKQSFRIFNEKNLPMSTGAHDSLTAIIQDALLSKITPTFPVTYVHVERNSVRCDASDNCTMNIYIDSPEAYFALSLKTANGIPSYTISQIPWKGIN
jgi:hypothetical protein